MNGYVSALVDAENRSEAAEAALELLDQVRDDGDMLLDDAFPVAIALLEILSSGGGAWPAEVLSVLWGVATALGGRPKDGRVPETEIRIGAVLKNADELVWRFVRHGDPEVRAMAVNLAVATAHQPAALFDRLVVLCRDERNPLARACIAAAAMRLANENRSKLAATAARWRDELLEGDPLVRFRVARELTRADDPEVRARAEVIMQESAEMSTVVWVSEV